MQAKLRVGHTVRRRSGGPVMTVFAVEGERACCHWWDDSRKLHQEWFPLAELVLAKPPPLPPEGATG